jgi:hypothetical protein
MKSLAIILPVAAFLTIGGHAHAQYMYLDTNGDSLHTEADVIHPSGPTVVDVWLRTDANRDGTPAVCASAAIPLTIFSYEFILQATGGTVSWSPCTMGNHACLGQTSDSTDFDSGLAVIDGRTPGLYKLASISVTVTGGTPSIRPVTTTHLGYTYINGFGSACPGIDLGNTILLGSDWFDIDGARYGGWSSPPQLVQPATMVLAEGSTADQDLIASDPDGSLLTFSKVSGPSYMTVSNAAVHVAPGYLDSGRVLGEVRVDDGVGSDLKSFGLIVTNVNRAPVFSPVHDVCVEQGQDASTFVQAQDPDRDPVSISAEGVPAYGQFNDTGYGWANLVFHPTVNDTLGRSTVTISATDGSLVSTETVAVRLRELGGCSGRAPSVGVVAPNPMNPTGGTLSFWIPQAGHLRVTLHDMTGRLVRVLVDQGFAPAGNYRFPIYVKTGWTTFDLASGVYFYRIESSSGVKGGRFTVVR